MQAPLHPAEQERLAALLRYDILDTSPELAYDRITTLAARYFGAPIALVSLVDDRRQWFKSTCGLNVRETHRDLAFCAYAILEDEVFVVEDTMLDSRFRENPLVTGEPFIRFYAGAPLRTPDNFILGTLCVIDSKPRSPLTAAERDTLTDLAAIVVDELELRKTAKSLLSLSSQLAHKASIDPLTQLPNRSAFEESLSASVKYADSTATRLAIFFVDLDDFKTVNDSLGHAIGDLLLHQVGQRLSSLVPPHAGVARLGGDEFLILVTDLAPEHAEALAEKVCKGFDEPFEVEGHRLNVRVSIGIAIYPDDDIDPRRLLRSADRFMYEAKRDGGGCYRGHMRAVAATP